MDIVIDTGVAIATQSVISEIAENAVIVTTAEFNSALNWRFGYTGDMDPCENDT